MKNRKKKKTKAVSEKKAWKEFEDLVARIERILAPSGATVTLRDKVADTEGQLREVDATIKMNVGSVPVLIAIECRNRSREQDKRWIEEIRGKKESIKATKMVAVSANGFSEGAMKLAKNAGIEIRTIKRITDNVINQWRFNLYTFQFRYNPKTYNYALDVPDGQKELLDAELNEIKANKTENDFWYYDFLFHSKSQTRVSFAFILEQAITKNQDDLGRRLKTEKKSEQDFNLDIKIPKGTFFFGSNNQFHLVNLKVLFEFGDYSQKEVEPTSVTYSDDTKDIFKGIEYKFQSPSGEEMIATIHQQNLNSEI